MKPVYYMQTNPKWANLPYDTDNVKDEFIRNYACGPTCMAMVLATWFDSKITPVQTCQMAIDMKDLTDNDGTEWEYYGHVAAKYNLKFKQTVYTAEAVTAIKSGALVICSMKTGYFTTGKGHFVLAYDVQNNNILVNDPVSTKRTQASIDLFKEQSKQYFIFYPPVKEMTYTEANKIVCQHMGLNESYWAGKENIDPYFKARVIAEAKFLIGKGDK